MSRATYVGTCAEPAPGTAGDAFPASGHDDPASCEYGAYLFQPDGCEYAFYCDPVTDLVFA